MSNSFWDYPIATIEKALNIRKQIEALQATLSEVYSGTTKAVTAKATNGATTVDRRKGKRSAAARAKMAAAQKARWAKLRAGKPVTAAAAKAPAKTGRKKRTMSPEARARIAAAQRARWAKQKAAA